MMCEDRVAKWKPTHFDLNAGARVFGNDLNDIERKISRE